MSIDFFLRPSFSLTDRSTTSRVGNLHLVTVSGLKRLEQRARFGVGGELRLEYIVQTREIRISVVRAEMNEDRWITDGAIRSALDLPTCQLRLRLVNFLRVDQRDSIAKDRQDEIHLPELSGFKLEVEGDREFLATPKTLKHVSRIGNDVLYFIQIKPE